MISIQLDWDKYLVLPNEEGIKFLELLSKGELVDRNYQPKKKDDGQYVINFMTEDTLNSLKVKGLVKNE